jgi:hypothetical protein
MPIDKFIQYMQQERINKEKEEMRKFKYIMISSTLIPCVLYIIHILTK